MKNLLLFLLLIWLLYPQENVQTVFYEDEDYSIYEIYFEKGELNTNNILNRFKNIQVLTIYPYINPIYSEKIKLKSYSFQNDFDIEKFKNKYIKELEESGFKNEAVNINLEGISLVKVKVYSKEAILQENNFNYKKIIYSLIVTLIIVITYYLNSLYMHIFGLILAFVYAVFMNKNIVNILMIKLKKRKEVYYD